MNKSSDIPLVYSCSGCSSAAQMANYIAVRLDRTGCAEMSCIAGVGGDVKPLVRTAISAYKRGRPIVAIDGCRLQCVKKCLERQNIEPDNHYILSDHGVKKHLHRDFEMSEAQVIFDTVQNDIYQTYDKIKANL